MDGGEGSRGVVLVTGGAGYIGSHTCKALAGVGYLPVVYDNLSRGHRRAVRWGPFELGDVRDRDRLAEACRRHRPQAVLHFAALAYVGESMSDPAPYWSVNVGGSLTLFEVMREAGIGTIVVSSTCATYGLPQALPIDESTPQSPINPYGASKLTMERALADYGTAYGLRSVALRYFNACGADPDGMVGEDHDPETHLIPLALHAASGQIPHLMVLGTDYPTPDGTCVRDYIHVADLARAHVQALDYLLAGGSGAQLNLGIGRGFSVREVIAAVERVTGLKVPVREAPRRLGDPPVLVAAAERARALIGFAPAVRELDTMIASAWNWHRRQLAAEAVR